VLGPALRRLLTAPDPQPIAPSLSEWQDQYAKAVRPFALASARPHEKDGPFAGTALAEVFGVLHRTLGPSRYLLLQGRHPAAIAALEALPQAVHDAAYQALLAEALTGLGEEHYRGRAWDEALAAFFRAAKLTGRPVAQRHAKMAADAGLYASRALLGEYDTRDDQAGAVALLEQAAELAPGDQALRAELGAAYAQLARKTSNEDRDYDTALGLLRKARDLAPEDRLAGDFLRVVIGNLASKLTDEGAASPEQLRRAADLWREAVGLDPDPQVKGNLGFTLSLLARHTALTGDRAAALELMTEAVANDPEGGGEDLAAEARRRMSVVLANYALDDLRDRPFGERAEALRRARAFDDSPEVRRVMCGAWRSQAVARFEAKQLKEAELLLQEAVKLAVDAKTRTEVTEDLAAVLRARAVQAANARRRGEAQEAIAKAVALSPGNRELTALQRSIEQMR
jgi:tetratricopeptide (TPR) repeat protein